MNDTFDDDGVGYVVSGSSNTLRANAIFQYGGGLVDAFVLAGNKNRLFDNVAVNCFGNDYYFPGTNLTTRGNQVTCPST